MPIPSTMETFGHSQGRQQNATYLVCNKINMVILTIRIFYMQFITVNYYNQMTTHLGEVIKSPSDNRIYKAIKLENELECLIIRDVDALKSSAALSMGVGSFKDPINAQGLAHYLEHMLFMGTAKYPDENEYSNFITKNAGNNNAYTSQQETNYMFEVSSIAFEEALDRFSQFFIAPLLNQNSAEKELNAVDSEHQKNKLNDSWRKYQLSKHISKDGHPFNKFSTGDKKSLSNQNLQNMLTDFYRSNYSANLMKLVVYGKQEIEVIESWVKEKFSAVPNHGFKRFHLESQPFDNKAFKKLFKILPVKDLKKLQLTWILPSKKQHYMHHPGNYISNLIGHEGKGSILSYLMKQGLVTSLSSGNYDNYDCCTEFQISIDLTEKGLTKIKDIVGYILYYIQMLKEHGCPKWFFEELQTINKLKFEFMDKKKGMMESAKIAKNMHDRKIEEILIYPYLMNEWRPELINEYLSQMTTENLFIFCQAKQFESECNLQEPVYGTKYACEDFSDLHPIVCEVELPERNIFLPQDLSVLILQPQKLPTSIYKSDFLDVFYKKDHTFGLPKANINLRLIFDGNFSVIDQIARTILLEMLKQHLRQFVYLAEMAQIDVQISFVSYISLEIKLKGFRDSLKLFVVEYLKRIFEFIPTDDQLFKTLIEKNKRKYANYFLDDPYKLAYGKSSNALRVNSGVPQEEKLLQIDFLTLDEVRQFNKNWKRKLFLESYFAGNITELESLEIAQEIEKFLNAHAKPHKKQHTGQIRAVYLPPQEIFIIEQTLLNKNEENQSVVVSFQSGELSIRSQLLLKLCESIYKDSAFDYLRTKEQLGYIVFCFSQDHRGVGGMMILVQSAIKSSHEIMKYINIFINEKAKQILDQLTQQQFNTIKTALQHIKQEKDKNLNSETSRYWGEIVKHKYIFDRKERELQILSQITVQQMKEFINKLFYLQPKRLEMHLISDKKKEINLEARNKRIQGHNNFKVYTNVESFTRKMVLYPDFYAPNP